jgi:hypothetical protein
MANEEEFEDEEYDMYCDVDNHIQLFYKVDLMPCLDEDEEDYDDIEEAITDPEKQKPYVLDLLGSFQSSFMGKTFPLCNNDKIPKGVKPANHFLSFDKEHGLVLCVGFYLDPRMLTDTDATKATLHKLHDALYGQFSDGWGENGFGFTCDNHLVYANFHGRSLVKIVAPVGCHCGNFNVKWSSIDEIEHINWMLYHDNGAVEMLDECRKGNAENLKNICNCGYQLERYKYVSEHLDHFFFV